MAISTTVKTNLEKSSWIRKMFEQGALLKKEFGADRVFDFSLGNPNLEPPQQFFDILRDEAYASSGSACTSRVLMPSHILTAIGRKPQEAHGSLLMKISKMNTEKQIDYILATMPKVVKRIRSITGGIKF